MQLTLTTDYAIKLVCLLAKEQKMCSTSTISTQLGIPVSYVPKITRILKNIGIVEAVEGAQGGYVLKKDPRVITLLDVMKATESTVKINRCLEQDEIIYKELFDQNIYKTYVSLQETFEQKLSMVTIASLIGMSEEEEDPHYFGEVLVNPKANTYQCLYIGDKLFREKYEQKGNFNELVENYIKKFVHVEDQNRVQAFLLNQEKMLNLHQKNWDDGIRYRRKCSKKQGNYVWVNMEAHYDHERQLILLSIHNSKLVNQQMTEKEAKINAKERSSIQRYWDIVSLLEEVLDQNHSEREYHLRRMEYFTAMICQKVSDLYPKFGLSGSDIEHISRLAPIHDIGKIFIPIEILNKTDELSKDEMALVKKHTTMGADLTLRLAKGDGTQMLSEYSYNICKYHHERYDGSGYPEQLKGEQIPLCAQVVGIADAYDSLIEGKNQQQAYVSEMAIQMIMSGECGAFSKEILHSFLAAAMEPEWKRIIALSDK